MKKMICMRGVPGSGKTTRAKEIKAASQVSACILSTDDWFMCDQVYLYDPKQIPTAHKWNQDRAARLAAAGFPLIIIDNTHMRVWEMRVYLEIAEKYSYEFETCDIGGGDLAACAERNQHGVPAEVIYRMASSYQVFDGGKSQILNACPPWDRSAPKESK